MNENINIADIKQKMFDKLKPSGWDKVFKHYIFSNEFIDSLLKLYKFAGEGKRFTPPLKNIFRAFEECPYDELKVVIIGQDPYPQFGVADGIAFSCSNNDKPQPSLKYIFDELERQYAAFRTNDLLYDPLDLKRWSNQGILMLNTALTCEIGKIGSHYDIWKTFTAYLLDHLNTNHTGLIYVFMGKKAEDWSDLINDKYNYKFTVNHPASAAYRGGKWDSKNLFVEINKLLNKNHNLKIIW
tara:strand:+ start:2007 stop:2729 length:723 start_codon:yes stop_codon:yes gene_type:complete